MAAIIVFAGMAASALWVFIYAFTRNPPRSGYYSNPGGASGPGFSGWSGSVSDRRTTEPVQFGLPPFEPPRGQLAGPVNRRDLFAAPPPGPPPPVKIRRAVLSSDHVENEMLAILRDAPNDAGTRMVYGDWLEDRGFVARAKFVRGTDEYADHVVVRDETDTDWRAITCRERVRCDTRNCPRAWNAFEPVPDDERVRHCGSCAKIVRYCCDFEQVYASASRGEGTVLDLAGRLPPSRTP